MKERKCEIFRQNDLAMSASVGRLVMAVLCPECDSPLDLNDELDEGETVECEECGAELEVVSIDPVALALVDGEGYDDEEVSHPQADEDD